MVEVVAVVGEEMNPPSISHFKQGRADMVVEVVVVVGKEMTPLHLAFHEGKGGSGSSSW